MPLPTKYNDYSDLVLWINFVFQIRISGIIQYVLFYVCLLLFMEMFFFEIHPYCCVCQFGSLFFFIAK